MVGDVTIAVYDMLGTERSETAASIQKNNPVELALPDADGVYNIVVSYGLGMSTMKVVHQQK